MVYEGMLVPWTHDIIMCCLFEFVFSCMLSSLTYFFCVCVCVRVRTEAWQSAGDPAEVHQGS